MSSNPVHVFVHHVTALQHHGSIQTHARVLGCTRTQPHVVAHKNGSCTPMTVARWRSVPSRPGVEMVSGIREKNENMLDPPWWGPRAPEKTCQPVCLKRSPEPDKLCSVNGHDVLSTLAKYRGKILQRTIEQIVEPMMVNVTWC